MAPYLPARQAQPFDLLVDSAESGGWAALEELLKPAQQATALQPEDQLAKFMFGLCQTVEGRAMFEWMMDISLRQPLRVTGRTIEETALAAATRQGINGFAEAVLNAIAHGGKLVEQSKNQNGAGS